MLALLMLSPAALAGSGLALSLSGDASPAASRAGLSAMTRYDSGLQLGVEGLLGAAQVVYLDGWPVSSGTIAEGGVRVIAPLTHRESVQLDLQVAAGGYRLWAAETDAPQAQSAGAQLVVTPLATMKLHPKVAAQLGWSAVLRYQLDPSITADAMGQLLVVGASTALSDSLQLGLRGETGGLFGYGGDGAKYLARATVSLRWIPGAADSWFNL